MKYYVVLTKVVDIINKFSLNEDMLVFNYKIT